MSHTIMTGRLDSNLRTEMDTYGIVYPCDGYVDIGFPSPDDARQYLASISDEPSVAGAVVFRIRTEEV